MTSKPGDLDALLDAALQSYTTQAPLIGLEQRVIRRAHTAVRPWRIWLPVAAVFATACFVLMIPPRKPPPVQDAIVAAAIQPEPVITAAPPARPPTQQRNRAVPKPAALSEGERALLRFLVTDPVAAREVLRDSLLAVDKPMTIEALTIQPLGQPLEIQPKELNQ